MLKIDNVSKWYGEKEVLKQVSFMIQKGSCLGLVGPNGAGKSTLLKILVAIIQDFTGEIQLSGSKHDNLKKITGYVPQDICLEQNVSAYHNLCFFGKLYGLRGRELKKRATEVLEDISLLARRKDKVKEFSGGMKRRLNIGCALMHRPELVIMDEPTVGIDPQSRRYIFDMIRRLTKQGCTIIYATHYMEEVEELCDEVIFVDQGRMVKKARVEDLLSEYAIPAIYMKGSRKLPETLSRLVEISEQNGGLLLRTRKPLFVMEELLRLYRDNPAELKQLEMVRPKLEDVFFSLTGTGLRDK